MESFRGGGSRSTKMVPQSLFAQALPSRVSSQDDERLTGRTNSDRDYYYRTDPMQTQSFENLQFVMLHTI